MKQILSGGGEGYELVEIDLISRGEVGKGRGEGQKAIKFG